jgi:hypothetical protein
MDRKINGKNADYLKRKAKSVSKSLGVTHTEALNLIAQDLGHPNWENFINNRKIEPRPKAVDHKPVVPNPPVLDYRNFMTGAIIGQHPNKKMSIRRHARVGSLLQELLEDVEYHKRAKNAVQDVRIMMDTWLGCEYSEAELAYTEFNQIYYGKTNYLDWKMPTQKRQEQLKRILRQARAIIDRTYHDCKPLDKLHQLFNLALIIMEKWPKNIKAPGLNRFKGQVPSGTFVRLDHNKQIGVVFNHNPHSQIIEGYTNGGRFLAGRHEVSVLRKQLILKDFKPMRLYLPYGKWICADGREVLFNRDYCPIWERSTDGVVVAIQPDVYVKHEKSEHYYNDRTAPYYDNNKVTFDHCLAVLNDWGVEDKPNILLEMLPAALAEGNVGMLSPKGMS